MTLSIADRLFETTITTGTGPFTLQGAVAGFQGFAVLGTGKKTTYYIDDADSVTGIVQKWMDVIGTVTVTSGVTTLSVDQVLASSLGGTTVVNFGSGTKNVRGGLGAKVLMITDENLNDVRSYGTDGGTANAHAVTMPYLPLAYSDGMPIMYRVNVTNTTAGVTINVNSLGVKALKVNGADPGIGVLMAGTLIVGFYKAANNTVDIIGLPQPDPAHGQCRMIKSGTNVVLQPYNGNKILVNGMQYSIPSAGVSLAPTGLTPATLYYIYAYMNSGTMTLEASTTGHSTDTTTGVEIKTGDATRTLVGMVRPITGPAFADTDAQRFVLSWFNRRSIRVRNFFTANRTVTSTTYVEVNTEIRNEFLAWLDEVVSISGCGGYSMSSTAAVYTGLAIDGATLEDGTAQFGGGLNSPIALTCQKDSLAEGYHYVTIIAKVSGNTMNAFGGASGTDRCSLSSVIRG